MRTSGCCLVLAIKFEHSERLNHFYRLVLQATRCGRCLLHQCRILLRHFIHLRYRNVDLGNS